MYIKKVKIIKCPYCEKENILPGDMEGYLNLVKEKSITCYKCKCNFNLDLKSYTQL